MTITGPTLPRRRASGAIGNRLVRQLNASNRAVWLWTFVPLVILYLLTMRTQPANMANDPTAVTPSAWSLAHHGTPVFSHNEAPWPNAWLIPAKDGGLVSNREPGLIGLAAIFYRLFSFAKIGDVWPASIAAALVSAAAMAMVALVVRRFVSGPVALGAGLIGGTATTTWAVSGTALWPHGPDQFYLAVAMLGAASGAYALHGISFGLAILTRPPIAVAGALMGVWQSLASRSVRPAVVSGLFQVSALCGYLAYSAHFWGSGLQPQYSAVGGDFAGAFLDTNWSALRRFGINVMGIAIAPGKGILPESPFLILLIPGLAAAWRVSPSWVRSAAVSGVVYLLVQLKANRFTGGEGFWAYRYGLGFLTLAAPILVLSWREWVSVSRRRISLFAALVTLSIGMQAIGAMFYRGPTFWDNPWTLDNYSNALLELPRSLIMLPLLFIAASAIGVYFWLSRDHDASIPEGVIAVAD